MAEIATSRNTGVKKGKKLSTRVDLTPMVDLGFLLITFFIFTTNISQPTAMKLILPKDALREKDSTRVKASGVLTLMPSGNDRIYYYERELLPDGSNIRSAGFNEIRNIILDKKRRTKPGDFAIIIKPGPDATYKNTVDILDEMKINEIRRYALVDMAAAELALLSNTRKK